MYDHCGNTYTRLKTRDFSKGLSHLLRKRAEWLLPLIIDKVPAISAVRSIPRLKRVPGEAMARTLGKTIGCIIQSSSKLLQGFILHLVRADSPSRRSNR